MENIMKNLTEIIIIGAITFVYLVFKLLSHFFPKKLGGVSAFLKNIFKYIITGPAWFIGGFISPIKFRRVLTVLLICSIFVLSFICISYSIVYTGCLLLLAISLCVFCIIHNTIVQKENRLKNLLQTEPFETSRVHWLINNDHETRYNIIFESILLILEGFGIYVLISKINPNTKFAFLFPYLQNFVLLFFYFCSIVLIITNIIEWFKQRKKWDDKIRCEEYFAQKINYCSDYELEAMLAEFVKHFSENDSNPVHFDYTNIPYGRTAAFLSYFEKSIDFEQPIYYSPKRSPDDNELREYGTLVTTQGIYFSNYQQDDINIPFSGIWNIKMDGNVFAFSYGFNYFLDIEIHKELQKSVTSISYNCLVDFFKNLFHSKIPLILYNDIIVSDTDEGFTEDLDSQNEKLYYENENTKHVIETAGLGADAISNAQVYGELKNNMNGARGSGYGAEYGNAVMDRLSGYEVENLAAQLDEHGRQVKHGADKSIKAPFGEKINVQTKYCKTARESVGEAFEHKQAIYLNPDGSMMAIEVPCDQYSQAIEEMQKRINSGQVPGESNPDNAHKYVKKGFFTYEQSFNITRSCSIDGITVDIAQGTICSAGAGAITMLLTFATAVWNGEDLEDAAKQGLASSIKVMGKGTAIFTVTMQLSRGTIINPFDSRALLNTNTGIVELTEGFIRKNAKGETILKISDGHLFALEGNELVDKGLVSKGKVYNADGTSRGFAYIDNPVFKTVDGLAKKINSTSISKSSFGKTLGLDKINGKELIGGAVTLIVVFGPDLCRAFQGKISPQQLFKNSAIGAAGLAGAVAGNAILPVIGGIIGGAVSGFVAKKVLDNFIEDDAKEMFQIIKEEFLDVVMLYSLSREEFDEIISLTFANKDLPKIMRNMYAAEDSRGYARKGFIEPELMSILSRRQKITNEMFNTGVLRLEYDVEET